MRGNLKFLIASVMVVGFADAALSAPKKTSRQAPQQQQSREAPKASGFSNNPDANMQLAINVYRRGDVEKAIKMLAYNATRFPKHQPTFVMLADIYSSIGEFKKAASLYRRVSSRSLKVSSAFYFGLSMYATNNCKLALKAFNRVIPGSRNYFDGLFYSGACQMKAQRWDKAEKLLGMASNVSPELRSSQRRLYVEASRRRQAEERGDTTNMRGYTVYAPPPLVYAAPMYSPYRPYQPYGPQQKKLTAAPTAKPKSGVDFSFTPRGTSSLLQTDTEYHGYKSKTSMELNYGAGGAANARYNFVSGENSQGFVALLGDVDYYQYSNTGATVTNTATSENPDQITAKEEVSPEEHTERATVVLKPSFECPLGESWAVVGFLEYKMFFMDLPSLNAKKDGERESTKDLNGSDMTIQAGLNMSVEKVFAALNYMNYTRMTEAGEGAITASRFDMSLRKSWDTFDIGLDGKYEMAALVSAPAGYYLASPNTSASGSLSINKDFGEFKLGTTGTYSMVTVEEVTKLSSPDYGPASKMKFEAVATMPFDNDFKLTATGAYSMLSEYRLPNKLGDPPADKPTDPSTDIVGDGAEMEGIFAATFKPWEWVSLQGSYSIRSRTWVVEKKENQVKFEQSVSNVIKTMKFSVSLNYTF